MKTLFLDAAAAGAAVGAAAGVAAAAFAAYSAFTTAFAVVASEGIQLFIPEGHARDPPGGGRGGGEGGVPSQASLGFYFLFYLF